MSGLRRSDLVIPLPGRKYPYRQQTDHYPGVDVSFVQHRGGALQPSLPAGPVTDLHGEKPSYAAPTNVLGLAAFRKFPADNSAYSASRHWRAWPSMAPFMPTPFEQPDAKMYH